jgi:hypothetical protein
MLLLESYRNTHPSLFPSHPILPEVSHLCDTHPPASRFFFRANQILRCAAIRREKNAILLRAIVQEVITREVGCSGHALYLSAIRSVRLHPLRFCALKQKGKEEK